MFNLKSKLKRKNEDKYLLFLGCGFFVELN